MPFTPAHTAAAWPVRRVLPALPLAPLVIGTWSPDFEYMIRLQPRGAFGHTPLGLVVFCLPLSLAVWLAFERWVRPLAADGAPLPLGPVSPTRSPRRSPLRAGTLACVSVLLGAATHVVWDGFTHRGGWAVMRFPTLLAPASSTWPVPRFWIAQQASTVIGLVLVVVWIVTAWRSGDEAARRMRARQGMRLARVASLVIAGAVAAAIANVLIGGNTETLRILGRVAVGAMDGGVLTLFAVGIGRRRSWMSVAAAS
jgi:hypothetical protein